ncbi:MAG: DUF374 domain-containing protein [Puniceicoccales bacterium]|jgi:lysophospholipid acyltransferase (LPLAT)-like uncharacterized protein|nr:DUF374 domain-containing protein [Puniceicoccales bacterium]
MMSRIPRIQTLGKWWQRVLVHIVVVLLKAYWATFRIVLSDEAKRATRAVRGGTIFAFWHENLFAAYSLKNLVSGADMYGLVSPSRDGAWLAGIFDKLAIKTIRGSSKRGGLSAIDVMVQKLAEGASIAITPDGPRGPRHKFKNGTAMTAKRANADIILVAVKYSSFFTLPTWDKFKVPFPFAKICVDCKTFPHESFKDIHTAELTTALGKCLNTLSLGPTKKKLVGERK